MQYTCPSLAREEIQVELNKATILTRLVTTEFPTPFYRTTADQRHLRGKRRKGVYVKERTEL